MANPKTGPKKPSAKGGERTVSGRMRRNTAPKANPEVDTTNWRRKVQVASICFDDKAKAIFLEAFARHGRKKHAADAAGVTLHTVRNHLKDDPDFAKAYDGAGESYRDQFVEHAIGDLATKGVAVMAATKDGDIYEARREYPVPLIILELRRIDPAYRDKQEIDITSGGGVLVAPAAMTPAEWVADQERKNAERKNPMEKDASDKATVQAGKPLTDAPKEVTLLDRAVEVASRNAKKVTR